MSELVHNHDLDPSCREHRAPDGTLRGECMGGELVPPCPDCGKPAGSFACKIRHIQVNTGDAKAARD